MRALLVAIGIVGFAAGEAAAESRYSNARVSELKGRGGAVVGAKISLRLHSVSSSHSTVFIGLLPSITKVANIEKGEVQNPRSKRWLHRFEDQTGMRSGEVRELTFEIRYAQTRKLVPGEKYQLATSWGAAGAKTGNHVFGVNWGGRTTWGEPEITLPKKKPAAPAKRKPAAPAQRKKAG